MGFLSEDIIKTFDDILLSLQYLIKFCGLAAVLFIIIVATIVILKFIIERI